MRTSRAQFSSVLKSKMGGEKNATLAIESRKKKNAKNGTARMGGAKPKKPGERTSGGGRGHLRKRLLKGMSKKKQTEGFSMARIQRGGTRNTM